MKKIFWCVLFLNAIIVQAEIFVWTGAAGDGKWSTPGNWKDSQGVAAITAPTSSDNAKFSKINSKPIVVDIDTLGCTCNQIIIESNVPAVSFGGDGVLTIEKSTEGKAAHRNESPIRNLNNTSVPTTFDCKVVFSGANRVILCGGIIFNNSITFTKTTYIWFGDGGSCSLNGDNDKGVLVKGNIIIESSTMPTLYMSNGVSTPLIFDAADMTSIHELPLNITCNGNSSVYFKRGQYNLTGNVSLKESEEIDFRVDGSKLKMISTGNGNNPLIATNGFNFVSGWLSMSKTSHVNHDETIFGNYNAMKLQGFIDGVFAEGKEFSHRQQGVTFPDSSLYPYPIVIDGVYNHTNTAASVLTVRDSPLITGKGQLNVCSLTVVRNVFEELTLSLGGSNGGEISFPYNSGTVAFTNMTLGCWGDWKNGDLKTGTFTFGGDITIDTDDIRENGESHTISLKTVVAAEDLNLTIKGNGTVAFDWANGTSSPTSLTVDDGATFLASNMTAFTAHTLTFGSDAFLFLNKGAIELPQGANLSVTAALKDSMETADDMIPVATAKEFNGLDKINSDYLWRVRKSATLDGYFDLVVGLKNGLTVIIR